MYSLLEHDKAKLETYEASLKRHKSNMMGYPLFCNPPMAQEMKPFLEYVLNNLGDPFVGSAYQLNTFEFECEVVKFIADLYKLPNFWGYITNGGSEGNLKGLSIGLGQHPNAIIYYSDKSHYSVSNAAKLMRAKSMMVKTDDRHSICLLDFEQKVDSSLPAVNLNVGTTMSGAIDDVQGIVDILQSKGIEYYVHVDAALSGLILPFLPTAPKVDFDLPIGSVSISGHKFLGCPFPCGVIVTRHFELGNKVEYINSTDSTLFGSRNGLASIAWWCAIKGYGMPGLEKMTRECMALTGYALDEVGKVVHGCWRNQHSNTVMIPKPRSDVVQKWQLASDGNWSHIILMPHLKQGDVDRFVADLCGV